MIRVALIDRDETLRQVDRMLGDVLPLLALSCAVVGGICAMQGLGYIERYAASEVFGWAAAMSAFRDVGPLLLGCGLAARCGARNTAEIAVMAARERLDAVRALGLDPWRVLLLPRFVATTIVAALVYFPACAIVLVVAFVLAQLIGDQSLAVSFWSVVEYWEMPAVWNGLLRLTLFGVVVGASSCFAGVSVERSDRSAGAVGRAVYASSVGSLAGVMTTNALLSVLGGADA